LAQNVLIGAGMKRERWLVLAACLAFLRLLPSCANRCLNPQPEPPGDGCEKGINTTAGDAGRGAGGPDAGSSADAQVDQAATSSDVTDDGAKDAANETANDVSTDAQDDGAFTDGERDSAEDGRDIAVSDENSGG
jgi:hypothetical protein